jgi:hypothetical protein
MRYSPTLRIDYEDDTAECVVSGEPLIEGSVREMFDDISDEAWVELDPLPSLTHAVRVREEMDEAGIPCYIEAIMGSGTDGYNGIIMVPDDRFEEALEIQQNVAPPDDDDLLMDPDADDF